MKKSAALAFLLVSSLSVAGCFKPDRGASRDGSGASFFISKVDGSVSGTEFNDGFSIPKEADFTFTVAIKDQIQHRELQGAGFEIDGGSTVQRKVTNQDGLLIWTEKIPFNYFDQEMYLPLERTIRGTGGQSGALPIHLLVNPWQLTDAAKAVKQRLDGVRAEWIQESTVKPQAASQRNLFLEKLPIESQAVLTGADSTRDFKLRFVPKVLLKTIEGKLQATALTQANLKINASLIEVSTEGGVQVKTKVAESNAVAVEKEKDTGDFTATIRLPVRQGNLSSTFYLAVKLTPVGAPSGLGPFEGLFDIGDLSQISTNGPLTGELKTSNADGAFAYSQIDSQFKLHPALRAGNARVSGSDSTPIEPTSVVSNSAAFNFDKATATWSGPVDNQSPNQRTLMYYVTTCALDMTNGGRKAAGVTFTVTRADGVTVDRTASTQESDLGCITWEEKLDFNYLAPEKWTIRTATIKHKSGFETKISYAVAPYERFNFFANLDAQREFIALANKDATKPSRLIVDGFEFNLRKVVPEVDGYMGLRTWRRANMRIPMRVYRPSNLMNGEFQAGEPLRPGKYLFRAAYVVPTPDLSKIQNGIPTSKKLMVAPMRNRYKVVDAELGFLPVVTEFPIDNIALVNARGFIVFDIHLLDPMKIPKDDPYLLKTKLSLDSFVDRGAQILEQTFLAGLSINKDRDFSITTKISELENEADLNAAGPGREMMEAADPLRGMTVAKLYQLADAEANAVTKDLNYLSKPGSLLARSNADYVSLYNEEKMQKFDPRLGQWNLFLPRQGSTDALLKILNDDLRSKRFTNYLRWVENHKQVVTRETLVQFIRNQIPDQTWLAAHFCLIFADQLQRQYARGGITTWLANQGGVLQQCIDRIARYSPDQTIYVDRKFRVLERGAIQTRATPTFDIMSGGEYAMSRAQSLTWGRGVSASLGLNVNIPIVSEISGVAGLAANIHADQSTSKSLTSTAATLTSVSLTVEQREVDIQVKKYEECALVRLTPAFWASFDGLFLKTVRNALGARADEIMTHGLMMCTGTVSSIPKTVPETYYSFGHVASTGNYNDGGDLTSNPWMIALRGQNDFALFMEAIQGKVKSTSDVSGPAIDHANMTLDRMKQAYRNFSQASVGSMPTYLTVTLPPPANAVKYPLWH